MSRVTIESKSVGYGIRRLLLVQLVLMAAISAVFLVIFDVSHAAAAGFGGSIAVMNALLAMRCASRDARALERTPQQSLAALYLCVVQRFVVAALLFALGLGALKLNGLPLLAGFIAGQFVMIIIGTQQLKK
jgi:ATP synthase protein I